MGIMMLNGGLLTTIQDAGRRGYQRYGMGVSGAVDVHSYVYANILVGNTHNEAVLEVTLMGPVIEFTSNSVIAVTGGDLSPMLNGAPLPMYRAVQVQKGSILSFGPVKSGCRAYISFAGGLAITPVMGSRSTYIKAHIGGYEGRNLQAGDEIAFRRPASCPPNVEKRVMQPEIWNGNYTVRVIMGPQDDRFTKKGIDTFLHSAYTVKPEFDRMGYRLAGPEIEHVKDGNIITDGISFGAIQVPDDKQPIIMLADRQTTGGYAKIANVINVDMPMIAQSKAGDTIRFEKTDIGTAQDEFIRFLDECKRMSDDFDAASGPSGPVAGFGASIYPSSASSPAAEARFSGLSAPAPLASSMPARAASGALAPAAPVVIPAGSAAPAPAAGTASSAKAAPAPETSPAPKTAPAAGSSAQSQGKAASVPAASSAPKAAPAPAPAAAPAPNAAPAPAAAPGSPVPVSVVSATHPGPAGSVKTFRMEIGGREYEISVTPERS